MKIFDFDGRNKDVSAAVFFLDLSKALISKYHDTFYQKTEMVFSKVAVILFEHFFFWKIAIRN